MKTNGFGGDHMHERPALDAGKGLRIDFFSVFFFAQNEPATRTAQGLVRGRCHKIGMFDGAGVQASRHESGDVRNIGQQICAHFTGDLTHPCKIDDARIGAGAHRNHPWLMSSRHFGELVVIDLLISLANAVMNDLEKFAGKIRFVAVSQMPAVGEIHRQHFIPWLQHRKIDSHVRAAA